MLRVSPGSVEYLRKTLLSEGFKNVGVFQMWKKGQVFGYARRISNDLEWHVRAFADGSIESELEPPRTTIYHLIRWPSNNDGIMAQLLQKYQIPFRPKPSSRILKISRRR